MGHDELRDLYLDLLKRSVLGDLDGDLLQPIGGPARGAAPLAWRGQAALGVRVFRVRRAPERVEAARARREGRSWPSHALTMIGSARLDNIRSCLELALREGVPGDFLEAGVWRGGACIFARGVLKAHGDGGRRVWVADSFRGLPPPRPGVEADAGDRHHTHDALRVPLDDVRDAFDRHGLLDANVHFLPGWFRDTLPGAPLEQLAVLRLDGDMYDSTMTVLETLYDRVSPGGCVIVDDHALPACRQAVEAFRSRRGILEPLVAVDWTGVWWRKA